MVARSCGGDLMWLDLVGQLRRALVAVESQELGDTRATITQGCDWWRIRALSSSGAGLVLIGGMEL